MQLLYLLAQLVIKFNCLWPINEFNSPLRTLGDPNPSFCSPLHSHTPVCGLIWDWLPCSDSNLTFGHSNNRKDKVSQNAAIYFPLKDLLDLQAKTFTDFACADSGALDAATSERSNQAVVKQVTGTVRLKRGTSLVSIRWNDEAKLSSTVALRSPI